MLKEVFATVDINIIARIRTKKTIRPTSILEFLSVDIKDAA